MYNEKYIFKKIDKIYEELSSTFEYKGWKWNDCIYHVIPMSLKNVEKEQKYIGTFNFEKSVIVFKSAKKDLNFNWIIEVDDIKRYGIIKTIHENQNWVTLVLHLFKGKRMVKILLNTKQSFSFLSAYKTWIGDNVDKFRGILLK